MAEDPDVRWEWDVVVFEEEQVDPMPSRWRYLAIVAQHGLVLRANSLHDVYTETEQLVKADVAWAFEYGADDPRMKPTSPIHRITKQFWEWKRQPVAHERKVDFGSSFRFSPSETMLLRYHEPIKVSDLNEI